MGKFLNIGIIIFYFALFFSPSLFYIFFSFVAFFIVSLIYFKSLPKTLFITSILSLPFSKGKSFSFGAEGVFPTLSPFVVSILLLSFFSFRKNVKIQMFEWLLMSFFIWGFASFISQNTAAAVLGGLVKIGIAVVFYITAKIYSDDFQVRKTVIFVLLSLGLFESLLALVQFLLGHPLGIYIEEGLTSFPYGRLEDESGVILRPNGTFAEPTYLARFLTILLPLYFLEIKNFSSNKYLRIASIALIVSAIIISLTRFSWFFAATVLIVMFVRHLSSILSFRKVKLFYLILPFIIFIIFVFFFPYILYRISVTELSFADFGSFDFRIKLIQESINLIKTYPLFGVGLNRFNEFASNENVTGLYDVFPVAKVHNVFLRIASEMGLPALFFFAAFVFFSYRRYFKYKRVLLNLKEKYFHDLIFLGSVVYILESMVGTIFLTPHLILFMFYLAVLNS